MRCTLFPFIFTVLSFYRLESYGQYFLPNNIAMYWLDEEGHPFLTFDNVKKKNPELVFLMNGGKFNARHEPIGLYIEKDKQYKGIQKMENTKLLPAFQGDGIFFIKSGKAYVQALKSNFSTSEINYGIQSGPMLVMNGKINPRLSFKGRKTMRNGVGITTEGKVYFACMETTEREFANHFVESGCSQALQLDTEVSRVWHKNLKEKVYGRFGVMIGAK